MSIAPAVVPDVSLAKPLSNVKAFYRFGSQLNVHVGVDTCIYHASGFTKSISLNSFLDTDLCFMYANMRMHPVIFFTSTSDITDVLHVPNQLALIGDASLPGMIMSWVLPTG